MRLPDDDAQRVDDRREAKCVADGCPVRSSAIPLMGRIATRAFFAGIGDLGDQRRAAAAVLSTLLLASCASVSHTQTVPTVACATNESPMTRDTLYFGRNRADGGRVDDAQWQRFVDDVVTPQFPNGFTVLSANGQWRNADGRIEREASMVLVVLHAGDDASQRAIAAVIDEYKRRFAQEAVLRERSASCVSF
jgi:Protein of unknown function (DUF3574)